MSQEKDKNQSVDSREVQTTAVDNREVQTTAIDSDDINEQSWAKPTDPSPAPADIAPIPPQQEGGGESNPQQGENGKGDSNGK